MPPSGVIGGQSLGIAYGQIVITTTSLQAAVTASQQAGQQIKANLNQIATGAKAAQTGTAGLSNEFNMLRQAAGLAGGIAGALQLIKIDIELARTAANADRTRSAFDSLAASSGRAGSTMLDSMRRASRGMISDSNLVLDANRAMGLGVAQSGEQLGQLLEVARVRSQAAGVSFDFAFERLVTGLGRASPRILDDILLKINETQVNAEYAASIHKTTAELTLADKQTALFNQVMKDTAPMIAAASGKAESSADKFEVLGASFDNAKKAAGDFFLALGANDALDGMNQIIITATKLLIEYGDTYKKVMDNIVVKGVINTVSPVSGVIDFIKNMSGGNQSTQKIADIRSKISTAESDRTRLETGRAQIVSDMASGNATQTDLARQDALLQQVNQQLGQFHAQLLIATGAASQMANGFRMVDPKSSSVVDPNLEKQTQDKIEWYKGITRIENDANAARLSATQEYESQRSETIRSYEQGLAREAQDFAINRQREAAQLADTIAQIGVDSARQSAKWAKDLAESIAQLQVDSGKRQAEAQEATQKRISEINEQYAKDREKATQAHSDTLLEAAANLDAKAVWAEQKNFARQSTDAKEAHDDAISKAKQDLADRSAKEAENLADRIAQEQKANQKRLDDAREADALRIQDAKDALVKQQTQEDQALRLQRGAEDQQAQLAQMAQAEAQKLAQIDANAVKERAALDEDFQKQLNEDGIRSNKWLLQQAEFKRLALLNFDDWWKEVNKRFIDAQVGPTAAQKKQSFIDLDKIPGFASGGAITRTGPIYSHAGEYMLNRAAVDRLGGFAGAQQFAMNGGGRGGHTLNLSEGAIQIHALPQHNSMDIAQMVESQLINLLESVT